MDLKKLVLIILMVVLVDADCSSGVQSCLTTYIQESISHLGSGTTALCNDIDAYIKCVFSQGCNIGSTEKQAMVDSTKEAMDRMNCSFTIADLIKRYGNSATALSPINTIFIMIMSFTLLILI